MFQFYQLVQTEEVKDEEVISEDPETYNESESINDSIKSDHSVKNVKTVKTVKNKTKKVRFVEPLKENSINTNGIKKYGNPTDIFDDEDSRILFWKFEQPNPWSTLYFNQTKNTFTERIELKL